MKQPGTNKLRIYRQRQTHFHLFWRRFGMVGWAWFNWRRILSSGKLPASFIKANFWKGKALFYF